MNLYMNEKYVCIEFFESRLDSSASMKNMKKNDGVFLEEWCLFNECDGDFYRLVTLV